MGRVPQLPKLIIETLKESMPSPETIHPPVSLRPRDPEGWRNGLFDRICHELKITPGNLAAADDVRVSSIAMPVSLNSHLRVRTVFGVEARSLTLRGGFTEEQLDWMNGLLPASGAAAGNREGSARAPDNKAQQEIRTCDFPLMDIDGMEAFRPSDGSFLALNRPSGIDTISRFCGTNPKELWRALAMPFELVPPAIEELLKDLGVWSTIASCVEGIVFTPQILVKSSTLKDGLTHPVHNGMVEAGGMHYFQTTAPNATTDIDSRYIYVSLKNARSAFDLLALIAHEAAHAIVNDRVASGRFPAKFILSVPLNELTARSAEMAVLERFERNLHKKGLGSLFTHSNLPAYMTQTRASIRELRAMLGTSVEVPRIYQV